MYGVHTFAILRFRVFPCIHASTVICEPSGDKSLAQKKIKKIYKK